jgi:hypothetical protein
MTIDDIYEQVIQAGPGCTITKRDIKDAFRIVPDPMESFGEGLKRKGAVARLKGRQHPT